MSDTHKKISSRSTYFHKRVFPLFWFGFLALFVFTGFAHDAGAHSPLFIVFPVVMAVFGYFFMKKLVFDLVDEVYDCGDHLLVKSGGREEIVKLSNIMNVSSSSMMNPPRIELRLKTPGVFGDEIAFTPSGLVFLPFAKSKIANDLIVRVDRARSARAA